MELLNLPAARIESPETDNAETTPLVGEGLNFLVEILVWGFPGLEMEKIDISDSEPHIRLQSTSNSGRMGYSSASLEKVIK